MFPLKVNRGEYTVDEYNTLTRSIAQKLSNSLNYPLMVCRVLDSNGHSFYIANTVDDVRDLINDWVRVYFDFMVIPDDI